MFSKRCRLLAILTVSGMIGVCISQPIPGRGQTTRHTVIDLRDLYAHAINDNGQVLSTRDWFQPPQTIVYLWEDGREREIFKAPRRLFVSDFNDKGQIVWDDPPYAFLWDSGKTTDLGTLGGQQSVALAINNRGQVVGRSEIAGSQTAHAFLWSNGEMRDLGTLPGFAGSNATGINDRGQVVGVVIDSANQLKRRAFLWEDGKMQILDLLPTGTDTDWVDVRKINNKGQVVGNKSQVGGTGPWGFLWEAGKMQNLCGTSEIRNLGLVACQINDMNDKGQIVGTGGKPVGGHLVRFGFLWTNGAMLDLDEAIASDSGWRVWGALHINNRGQILAGGNLRGRSSHLLLTPRETP